MPFEFEFCFCFANQVPLVTILFDYIYSFEFVDLNDFVFIGLAGGAGGAAGGGAGTCFVCLFVIFLFHS